MMSDWRRVKRHAESCWAAGLEMNLQERRDFISQVPLISKERTYDVMNPAASS